MKLSIVISVLRLKETIIFCVFYFFGGHVLYDQKLFLFCILL